MATHEGYLPSGGAICCTIPDIFYLPELVFGGLVWILVACTFIIPHNPQAYVMAVSLFCFVVTVLWAMIFLCGAHNNKRSWASADVFYHFLAAVLYLSASVSLAYVTIQIPKGVILKNFTLPNLANGDSNYVYKLDIAAVVFAFVTTLLYFVHTIFSAIRWKSF